MSAVHPNTARSSLVHIGLRTWVKGHKLISFFTLTFVLSWSMWVLAYLSGENILGGAFFLLGGFGPMISAAAIIRYTGGSIKKWAARIVHWRIPGRWYLYALGLPALIWTLINVELALLGQEIDVTLLPGRLLPALGTFLVVLTVGGGLEEPGWRGFALGRLQQRLSPVRATLLLGFVWGLWHLPIYGWLAPVLITTLAFFYTYLYNKTGSVLLVILLHATITPANDTLILMPRQVHGITDAVIFGTVLAAAIILILATRGRLGYEGTIPPSPERAPRLRSKAMVVGMLFLFMMGVSAAFAAASSDDVKTAERYVEQELRENLVPGAALGIVDSDGTVHVRAFGTTGRADEPVTNQTPFPIGSVSKSFTALAVMQLVEDGRVDLDAPVTQYLPWFRVEPASAMDQLSVRTLLTNTSGLPEGAGGPALHWFESISIQETARQLVGTKLSRPPASGFEYANGNFVLLGAIIEEVSGGTYADYLQTNVLDPLGMRHTYLSLEDGRRNGMAEGHRYWFGRTVPHTSHVEGLVPAGLLISTAEDMTRYMRMYLGEGILEGTRVLSRVGIETMQTPAVEAEVGAWAKDPSASYGMGLYVGGEPFGPEHAVFHPGGEPDFASMMVMIPGRTSGAVLLMNVAPEIPLPGAAGAIKRIGAGAASVLMGSAPAEGSSMRTYYWVFDGAVIIVLAVSLWTLARTIRRRPRTARSRLRGILRVARATLALVTGSFILAAPFLVAGGWREAFLWVPDLAITLGVLGALLVAIGGLRLVKLAQLHRSNRDDVLPPSQTPEDNLTSEPPPDKSLVSA